ncbi:MAG: radical SAM protein [Anaerolineaceae bacterium]|jgi:organic radical activating enzyme
MKERIRSLYDRWFSPAAALPAGIYQYQSPADVTPQYRVHLRLEPDGMGLMVVNAHTVLHLNQTAAEFAYHLVKSTPPDQTIKAFTQRYRVSEQVAAKDYEDFKERIHSLIVTPDLAPDTFLGFERLDPYSQEISAPYRLDCALTYRVDEESTPDTAPAERVKRELLTDEWKSVLQKAWDAGIPHVVFTGGEPTLRPDLPDLISFTESIGMVCGLLTDGLRFSDPKYLNQLLQCGLDHLMIVLEPDEDQAWEALRDILAADIFTTVHLTITQKNAALVPALLDRLAQLKVNSLSLSTDDAALKDTLKQATHLAADHGLTLVWDLPVPYGSMHPVAFELKNHEEPPKGAGKAWLYIEPDGDVLPTQGELTVLGNLLNDPWDKIWKNRPAA